MAKDKKDRPAATYDTLPAAGAAGPDLARSAHDWWAAAAGRAGIDATGLGPDVPLIERVARARARGLTVATALTRYTTDQQHSTAAQVRECVEGAAARRMWLPGELVSVDEGVSGRKMSRAGVDRLRAILGGRLAEAVLVFKISRLFRSAHRGYMFFQEVASRHGARAVSVTQGIDTAEEKTWKPLACLHGLMDELLLTTIADHVRAGLKDLFADGYVTGALTIGYKAVEVPGRKTNLGKPRTVPKVDDAAAALIRRHFGLIRDGMGLAEGWRLWVREGGPADLLCPSSVDPEQTVTALLTQTEGVPGVDFTLGLPTDWSLLTAAPGCYIMTRSHYSPVAGDWIERRYRGVFWYSKSGRGLPLAHVTDGTSNTLMFGECGGMTMLVDQWVMLTPGVGSGGLFTRFGLDEGTDYERRTVYNGDGPLQFSTRHPGVIHFAMCDGSVRGLTNPRQWNGPNFAIFLRLGGYADGEVTPDSD